MKFALPVALCVVSAVLALMPPEEPTTPGTLLDAQIEQLTSADAALQKPTSIVVRWTGQDQTAELQAAINEAAKRGLWLDTPDGREYAISDTLTIPPVYGFGWRSAPPTTDGTVHPAQRGCGFALVWKGPDDGRPMVRSHCVNGVFQMHLKGRATDNDPVPQNLVGWHVERAVVPTGKCHFDWLRVDDCAVGVRCGKVGDSRGWHCDCMSYGRFEAFGVKSAYELNNEQSMEHKFASARLGNCERFVDVWAGGAVYADQVTVLGPCKLLTIRAATPERAVGVGSGNGIFRFSNVKADAQTDLRLQLLDMERDAGVDVTFDGGILPRGADLLIDAKGSACVHLSGWRNLSAGSIRMAGVQRKHPTTGARVWVVPHVTVADSRLAGEAPADLLRDEPDTRGALEVSGCSGGFGNPGSPPTIIERP